MFTRVYYIIYRILLYYCIKMNNNMYFHFLLYCTVYMYHTYIILISDFKSSSRRTRWSFTMLSTVWGDLNSKFWYAVYHCIGIISTWIVWTATHIVILATTRRLLAVGRSLFILYTHTITLNSFGLVSYNTVAVFI